MRLRLTRAPDSWLESAPATRVIDTHDASLEWLHGVVAMRPIEWMEEILAEWKRSPRHGAAIISNLKG